MANGGTLNILLVEDDGQTAAYVSDGLCALGHTLEHASDGQAGLLRGGDPGFDCLVVDRMLPGYDGLTLVRTLRTSGVRTPIILLTAMGGVADRIQGLRAGADDYLIKPFDLGELEARIEALSRRPALSQAEMTLRADNLEIDRLARTVSIEGCAIATTASEFKILELLLLNAGRPVTKAMLLEAVFDLASSNPAAIIEPHVSRLRSKLEKAGGRASIRTVRGIGYVVHVG